MKKPPPVSLRAFACALFLLQGCYQFRVIPKDSPPATFKNKITTSAYLWGLVEPKRIPADNCHGNGMSNVTVKTNLGFSLISILTLGIVMPMTIEWECAKDTNTNDVGLLVVPLQKRQ